jgi:hypothetical protein
MTTTAPTFKTPKVKIPKIAGLGKPAAALCEGRLAPPDYILGLDMSLEHTGWCLHNTKTGEHSEGVFEPNPNKSKKIVQILGMKRLVWLREKVSNLALFGHASQADKLSAEVTPTPCISCMVFIEGYAFGAKGSSGISLGELGGVTRLALHDLTIPYIEIPPTQLKKFVTGKGGAPKDIMLKEVYKRWGADFNDDNIADAFSLVQLGRGLTNTQEGNLLAHQKEVVSEVMKTWLKDNPSRDNQAAAA